MYGLVNISFRNFITVHYGESSWEFIRQSADIEENVFVAMESYDDSLTYSLVGAASQKLEISAQDLLVQFGEFWVTETAYEHYGDLMNTMGSTIPEVLQNLDRMHAHVKLTFPDLTPPSFRCTEVDDHHLQLAYYSHRPGLGPFVIGLVQGIGKKLGTPASVMHLEEESRPLDHELYLVTFQPR